MKKVLKKNFIIKSRRTGNRLANMENQVVYEVFTADGSKKVKTGFYSYKAADKWLSETVKIANKVLEQKGEPE